MAEPEFVGITSTGETGENVPNDLLDTFEMIDNESKLKDKGIATHFKEFLEMHNIVWNATRVKGDNMSEFASLGLQESQRLFSKERFSSYDTPKQHFDNLTLIGVISENLGIAEILLRNKIDFIMSQNVDCGNELWLENLPAELDSHINKSLSKHKIISTQSLGFWLKVIDCYKIHSQLFSYEFLEDLNFKRYYERNANCFKNGVRLRRYHKASLLLHLLQNLRNRAFHFENLYKLNEDKKPKLIASIKSSENSLAVINLETSKIQVFLGDLIGEFRKEVESGEKGSAKNAAIITQNPKNNIKG